MKVLLRSDIDGVGKRGDIIDVSGGFARNHLLPAGKAIAASPGIESQAAAMRRSRDLRDARDRESSETVARTLVGNAITLQARAAGDRLFGSVSAADIVRQVEAQTGA
ncbi:MAG TPA: 50S ribosomal protein L9, partial [Acidimicrobiales bacterium]